MPVQRLSVGSARTLPAVLEEKANQAGHRPLLLRDGRVVATYTSFRARAHRLAARLQRLLLTYAPRYLNFI
jgi:non-ribosomal peptide synthetase component E (peptide arylation enzyme)